MYITTTSFYILCGAVFAALILAPYVVDYVFFFVNDDGSWLWASICTAILLSVPLVILLTILV